MVQECVHDVLRHGPRFVLADHGRFRALMATIVLNTLRTKATHHAAARRRDDGDRSLASDSVLYLDADGPVDDVSRPNDRLSRAQEEERVRLAKRLLDGADQDVLHLRTWDRLPYEEVGRRLGVGADAARKRHERALERLTDLIVRLRAGRLDEILRELDRAVTERDGAEREGS